VVLIICVQAYRIVRPRATYKARSQFLDSLDNEIDQSLRNMAFLERERERKTSMCVYIYMCARSLPHKLGQLDRPTIKLSLPQRSRNRTATLWHEVKYVFFFLSLAFSRDHQVRRYHMELWMMMWDRRVQGVRLGRCLHNHRRDWIRQIQVSTLFNIHFNLFPRPLLLKLEF
jgi:hypothetical protein